MKENDIEEAIERLEKRINDIWFSTTYSQEQEEKDLKILLSDYKRVLKENEILKEEKAQAWEEWNNLEQGSYETEQRLKRENEELKNDYENLNNSVVVKNHCIKNSIPVQKVKDKIEEYKNMLKTCNKAKDIDRIKAINERILELEELLEGRK